MTTELEKIDFAAIAKRESDALELRQDCFRRLSQSDSRPLLSRATANTKTRKSMRVEYRIVALSLAHAEESGHQVCPQSTPACRNHCVGGDSVGLAQVWQTIMDGRRRKTQFLFADRIGFIVQLIGELHRESRIAERDGAQLVARLNTFSDLPWETNRYGCIPQLFSDVRFYDYTKLHHRVQRTPANYVLCGSWSERPEHQVACFDLLMQGRNVAVPFAMEGSYTGNRAILQPLPERWSILGTEFAVYDGDGSDLRFLDDGPDERGYGRICGLRFKSGSNAVRDAGMRTDFVVMMD